MRQATLVLFLFLFPGQLWAQLSGTYTIGGFSPNYATISLAVADLNSQGISAPVIFDIRGGIYDERVTIQEFTRTGLPSDLVTFRKAFGPGSVLWENSSASSLTNWVVFLDGADYVKFNNLTFRATEATSTFGRLIQLSNDAILNQFTNNHFVGFQNVDSSNTTLFFETGDSDNFGLLFSNNHFEFGYQAISIDGGGGSGSESSSGTRIADNTFEEQYQGAIESRGRGTVVTDNLTLSASSASPTYIAMILRSAGSSIRRNQIDIRKGEIGIHLSNSGDISPNVDKIVNNMVSLRGTTAAYGMFVGKPDAEIMHNTVHIEQANINTAALRLVSIADNNQMSVRNNILINLSGGVALEVDDFDDIHNTDYNNYYTSASSGFVVKAEGSFNTLESWSIQTFLDLNTVSTEVVFVQVGVFVRDLHLAGDSIGDTDLSVPPIAGEGLDFDGETRPSLRTYMGADESSIQLFVEMDLTVYMSGPYNSATNKMNADLNSVIQTEVLSSPYDQAPFNCGDSEFTTAEFVEDHPDIVDWICVQLLTGSPLSPPMTIASERAGFLMQNGSVVHFENVVSNIFFDHVPGVFWVSVIHRNHLSIMTPQQIDANDGSGSFDFASLDAYGTNPQKSLSNGLWGMWGGDGEWTESVSAFDFLNAWLPVNGMAPGYYQGDFDMNASPTSFDFLNVFLPANGLASQVPERQ